MLVTAWGMIDSYYSGSAETGKKMQRLVRLMDDLDDVLGVVSAAASFGYILIIILSALLVLVGALALGLPGFVAAALLSGAAIGAATIHTNRS